MIVDEALQGTTTALRDTLRQATGRSDLDLAGTPSRLTGGYYAEMLRFRLREAPEGLRGDLVARIVPDPAAGEWEATIQQAVADQGFPTAGVRLVAPSTSPLGRYLIVMDAIDGRPPLADLDHLGPRTVARALPYLVRGLPDELAGLAAALHQLDPEPLAGRLSALADPLPLTVAEFVARQAGHAEALGRPDLVRAAERLLDAEPPRRAEVVTHGDLHPFNVLVAAEGPRLIDWSVACLASPGFTLGFTALVLAHPPLPVPTSAARALGPLARRVARRFLATYRSLTADTPAAVDDDDDLDWHRKVHALRILVETAGWDVAGSRPTAHPWLALEPVAQRLLDR